MGQANGSLRQSDGNQFAHEDLFPPLPRPVRLLLNVTSHQWSEGKDGVRTQSKSGEEMEGVLQDDKCCLSELGVRASGCRGLRVVPGCVITSRPRPECARSK